MEKSFKCSYCQCWSHAPTSLVVSTPTPALAPCAASHVHYELPLLPWTMAAGSKTRMPMCKSWKNLKGRQRHTTEAATATTEAATTTITSRAAVAYKKKKFEKRNCAQLLLKTKIRGAKQSCVKCVSVCIKCVCASVCASVCVQECVSRKPLDKNVQLQRERRICALLPLPKSGHNVGTHDFVLWFQYPFRARGVTAKPNKWGVI